MKDWTTARQALMGTILLVTVPLMPRADPWPSALALDFHVGSQGAHPMFKLSQAK